MVTTHINRTRIYEWFGNGPVAGGWWRVQSMGVVVLWLGFIAIFWLKWWPNVEGLDLGFYLATRKTC